MILCLWRLGITLALLCIASIMPATARAQMYLTQWGSFGSGSGQFNGPYLLATDAAGDVYVADLFNFRLQKFTSTGTYLTQWGSPGTDKGQFGGPTGMALDAAGDVYVADNGNFRIQKFTNSGIYL